MGQDPQTNVPLFILCALKLSDLSAGHHCSVVFYTSLYHHAPGEIHLLDDEFLRLGACLPAGPSRIILQYSAIFCNMLHHYLCSLIISKLFDHFDRFSMLWPRDALLIAFEQSPGFRTCTIFPMAVRLAYSESRSLLPGSANSDAEVR